MMTKTIKPKFKGTMKFEMYLVSFLAGEVIAVFSLLISKSLMLHIIVGVLLSYLVFALLPKHVFFDSAFIRTNLLTRKEIKYSEICEAELIAAKFSLVVNIKLRSRKIGDIYIKDSELCDFFLHLKSKGVPYKLHVRQSVLDYIDPERRL